MALHKLSIVETRHDLVVAQQLGGSAVRHTIPMSRVRFSGDADTLHPHGLGGALWWDDAKDAYYDSEPGPEPEKKIEKPVAKPVAKPVEKA
jgi:hypothetical protein